MAEIDCPVLIAQARRSDRAGDEAHRLHAESRKETTRLLLVEGTHEDYEGLKQRVGEVLDFVADAMGLRAGSETNRRHSVRRHDAFEQRLQLAALIHLRMMSAPADELAACHVKLRDGGPVGKTFTPSRIAGSSRTIDAEEERQIARHGICTAVAEKPHIGARRSALRM